MTDQDGGITTNEKAQATARIMATVVFAIGLAVAYLVWPSGISDLTLGSITFGGLLRVLGSAALALVFAVMAILLWI